MKFGWVVAFNLVGFCVNSLIIYTNDRIYVKLIFYFQRTFQHKINCRHICGWCIHAVKVTKVALTDVNPLAKLDVKPCPARNMLKSFCLLKNTHMFYRNNWSTCNISLAKHSSCEPNFFGPTFFPRMY